MLERRRKGQSHLVVDVDLIDAGQVDFGRIFGRRDIAVLGVEDIQTRVKGYGLAAARRSSDQYHALRFGEVLEVKFALEGLVSKRIDAQHRAGGIENTRHHFLAEKASGRC